MVGHYVPVRFGSRRREATPSCLPCRMLLASGMDSGVKSASRTLSSPIRCSSNHTGFLAHHTQGMVNKLLNIMQ